MEPRLRLFRIREWHPSDRRRPERLHDLFLRHLAPEDIRMRFGVTQLVTEDLFPGRASGRRGSAFAAWDGPEAILGVANLMRIDETSAELAVIVRSDLKRRGLGRALIDHALRCAALRGFARVVGYVLAENAPMLALARTMHFCCIHRDGSLVEVSRPVGFR